MDYFLLPHEGDQAGKYQQPIALRTWGEDNMSWGGGLPHSPAEWILPP